MIICGDENATKDESNPNIGKLNFYFKGIWLLFFEKFWEGSLLKCKKKCICKECKKYGSK